MSKKIGSFILLAVVFLFIGSWGPCVFAEEEKVTMSLSRDELILGDSLVLTIGVSGVPNPQTPQLSSVPGFDVRFRGVRQESFSSMTVIVNGRRVKNETSGGGYKFDFELKPRAVGTYTLGPLSVVINGKTYITRSSEIKVFDQSQKREDVFLEIKADKDKAYLGEKILLNFKWYFSKNIGNYHINIPWLDGLKGFFLTDPDTDQRADYQRLVVNGDKQIVVRRGREFYRGQEYMVISFEKILTPITPGKYTIEPTFLKCDVITGYRQSRRRGVFDRFFSSDFSDFFGLGRDAVVEPFATRSEPIDLTIEDVPGEEKPHQYNGAVGQFDFNVSLRPSSLKVGEPVTVTMKVSGSGNIKELQLPPIPDIESFKSYEPESKVNISGDNGRIEGDKTFEKVFIPRQAGSYRIPEITFAFFDPELGRYKTETRGPFEINVAPSDEKDDPRKVIVVAPQGEGAKRDIELVTKDIRYIMTDIGKVMGPARPPYQNTAIWLLFFPAPLLFLSGAFIYSRHRERLNTDIAFARSLRAGRDAREYFAKAQSAAGSNQAKEFYDALIKGLNTYLGHKLNRPIASIDAGVVEILLGKGLAESDAQVLRRVYDNADKVMFSSLSHPGISMDKDFQAVAGLMRRLERVLR